MPEGDAVFLAGRRPNDALAGKILVGAELRHPELSTGGLTGHAVLGVRSVLQAPVRWLRTRLSWHSA
ncbi:MAG: hypothetical protein ACRDQ5_23170 [Sciscionella sp.]